MSAHAQYILDLPTYTLKVNGRTVGPFTLDEVRVIVAGGERLIARSESKLERLSNLGAERLGFTSQELTGKCRSPRMVWARAALMVALAIIFKGYSHAEITAHFGQGHTMLGHNRKKILGSPYELERIEFEEFLSWMREAHAKGQPRESAPIVLEAGRRMQLNGVH